MPSNTKKTVLDTAQELVQTRGYNGFSFRQLADQVGIKSASVHYHFPTKGDLGKALLSRFRGQFQNVFAELNGSDIDPKAKIERYVEAFLDPLQAADRSCLGAMLAADAETLPKSVQEEVRGFVRDHERWLTDVLAEGRQTGAFDFEESPDRRATLLFSALEGASILAHATGDDERLQTVARSAVEEL